MSENNEEWLSRYRTNKKAVWIKCKLDNGEYRYYDTFSGWTDLKKECEDSGLSLESLSLQYRSHEVDIDIQDCEGIYLVRSVMGKIGDTSRQYYTTGKVSNGKVSKQMWAVPDLVLDKEYTDDVEDCFGEAIIYNEKTRAERKESV